MQYFQFSFNEILKVYGYFEVLACSNFQFSFNEILIQANSCGTKYATYFQFSFNEIPPTIDPDREVILTFNSLLMRFYQTHPRVAYLIKKIFQFSFNEIQFQEDFKEVFRESYFQFSFNEILEIYKKLQRESKNYFQFSFNEIHETCISRWS